MSGKFRSNNLKSVLLNKTKIAAHGGCLKTRQMKKYMHPGWSKILRKGLKIHETSSNISSHTMKTYTGTCL
jgi:hypothetical protein